MNPINTVLVLSITALVFLLWNILIGEKIITYLNDHGKTSLVIVRCAILRYVARYKKITTKNEGMTGEHYKLFFITAIVFAVLLIAAVFSAVLLKLD